MELRCQYILDMEVVTRKSRVVNAVKLKQVLRRTWGWEYFWLCLLVVFVLTLHFSTIMQPAQLVFDEQHYVQDARSILQGQDILHPEHPSLGKFIIVCGVHLFGDNPLGWRFFSVIFGTLCIVLFYLICRKLAMPKEATFLATFLLALENLTFVQASVAMLDVYSLTFMLGSFLLYLHGRYELSGISVGLGGLAKLSGALALPAIFLHWLFTRRTNLRQIFTTMLLTPISFLALMPLFDFAISGRWLNPVARIATMLSRSGSLTFANTTHEALSRPWDWILRPEMMPYWYEPHYTGVISFTIWALIIPSVLYMVFKAIKGSGASIFGLSWFASTYLFWIPVSYITDRISFVYYFYPTVGAICIGLGLGLSQLIDVWKTRKAGKLRWVAILTVLGHLLLHVSVFVILSPVFTWWSVP